MYRAEFAETVQCPLCLKVEQDRVAAQVAAANAKFEADLALLTPNDQTEVRRFAEYLKDRKSLTHDEFLKKWSTYENPRRKDLP